MTKKTIVFIRGRGLVLTKFEFVFLKKCFPIVFSKKLFFQFFFSSKKIFFFIFCPQKVTKFCSKKQFRKEKNNFSGKNFEKKIKKHVVKKILVKKIQKKTFYLAKQIP
jgi:hypothetical protein